MPITRAASPLVTLLFAPLVTLLVTSLVAALATVSVTALSSVADVTVDSGKKFVVEARALQLRMYAVARHLFTIPSINVEYTAMNLQ